MKNISTNLMTGVNYEIPATFDDRDQIDNFLKENCNKKVVVVQGLGFVGAVMSLVCANAISDDYAVIGIDLPTPESYWKIKSINDGVFPVISSDKKVGDFFKKSIEKNNFFATYDPYVYSKADFIIVDINLDVKKESTNRNELTSYNVDISNFKSAIKSIGKNCQENVCILIETTVPPGTTKIAEIILREELVSRGLQQDMFYLGHSYERVMPGPNYIDSIQNFYRVFSAIDKKSEIAIEKFLKTIIRTDEYPLTKLNNTNATEMSKVLENSFRAMNIAFIVEWSRFAEEAGVNLYEVVDAIRMRPTHKNIMLPGIGVGGYCLTKDPLLASWSKQNLISSQASELQMSELAVKTNDLMPMHAFNFFTSFFDDNICKLNISLLGVSYLADVGDTRYSPVEHFYKMLLKKSSNIKLFDPYINFWEEVDKTVSTTIDFTEMVNEDTDIIIFSTGHSLYKGNDKLISLLQSKNNLFIYDTIGVLNQDEIDILLEKHTVKVLGRGDL
jgi:UDP-N-acetyl-D-glucosamine dehydrogenase